ncbi:MAG TPA: hypothetical protein VGG64_14210 [Pirellulales bacterium]|jgi:hypothetical protein
MGETPKRRWMQFGIATLFVVVTIFCFLAAWLGHAAAVVREREALLQPSSAFSLDSPEWPSPISWRIVAAVFGYEKGAIYWDGISVRNRNDEDVERLRHAFPEARVSADDTWPQNMPIPEYRKQPPGIWR